MSGSNIFAAEPEKVSSNAYASNAEQNTGNVITDRPSVRLHQPAGGISQISFGEEQVTPTKPLSEAKRQELVGSSETQDDVPSRKQMLSAKLKEMEGSLAKVGGEGDNQSISGDRRFIRISQPAGRKSQIVFGEVEAEPSPRKMNDRKVADLLGRGLYADEAPALPLSDAKRRELVGSNIFAEDKPAVRESVGGLRKPPGGESSLTLM
eukprot:SM000008S22327  [mRNA]  locus=s8:1169265:1170358:+ [translate_table: standard]